MTEMIYTPGFMQFTVSTGRNRLKLLIYHGCKENREGKQTHCLRGKHTRKRLALLGREGDLANHSITEVWWIITDGDSKVV